MKAGSKKKVDIFIHWSNKKEKLGVYSSLGTDWRDNYANFKMNDIFDSEAIYGRW